MKRQRPNHPVWFAGLLGAALMVGTPLFAQADQGKWWNPQERRSDGDRRVERTERRPERQDRRVERRDRRGGRPDHDGRRDVRFGKARYQRDIVVLRDGPRGHRFRAHRVWVRPFYIERHRLCVIRPVRYFGGVSATLGGVRLHARFHDHDGWYGCNFCDARFSSYSGYHRHVVRCDDRPHGYRFEVRDWGHDDWCDDECEYDHGR
jgi:hypothetical protein